MVALDACVRGARAAASAALLQSLRPAAPAAPAAPAGARGGLVLLAFGVRAVLDVRARRARRAAAALPAGDLILAVDIGTSSVKAQLFAIDPDTKNPSPLEGLCCTAAGSAPHGDAAALKQRTERCMTGCLKALRRLAPYHKRRVVGVSFASLSACWVGVDAAGAPVTPLLTYAAADAASARAASDVAARMRRAGCYEAVLEATGTPAVHQSYVERMLLLLLRCACPPPLLAHPASQVPRRAGPSP